ncbi:HAD family phosphatase [Deinococcus sonorensis]|uniref:HAD family phosphatase n=2 Tax=Deinococcus sonorensis TaxID=309891 RepID=A0AAU7UA35_9DEIO
MTASPDRAAPSTVRFDAVLFDLDGVLVDSEMLANRVWLDLLAQHGLTFTSQEFLERSVGSSFKVLYEGLKRDFGWERPADFDARSDAALAAAFEGVLPIEGAPETLQALARAGVPYAVASNSRRDRLELKVRAAGLEALLPHRLDPALVGGHGKPAPDLYQAAARQLGVAAARCLVIEDSLTGVQAGVAAGATVWGLLAGGHTHGGTGAQLQAAGASRLLYSHAELRGALGL